MRKSKNQLPPLEGVEPDPNEPTGVLRTEVTRLVTGVVAAFSAVAGALAFAGVIVPEGADVAVGIALESVAGVVITAGEIIRSQVWSQRTVHRIDPAALVKD